MNEETIDALNGQVHALSMVIASIMFSMHTVRAEAAAAHLEENLKAQQETDAEQQTPAAEARARDATISSFVDLLKAVASRD